MDEVEGALDYCVGHKQEDRKSAMLRSLQKDMQRRWAGTLHGVSELYRQRYEEAMEKAEGASGSKSAAAIATAGASHSDPTAAQGRATLEFMAINRYLVQLLEQFGFRPRPKPKDPGPVEGDRWKIASELRAAAARLEASAPSIAIPDSSAWPSLSMSIQAPTIPHQIRESVNHEATAIAT